MSFNNDQPKVSLSDIKKSLKEDFSVESIKSFSRKFNTCWGMLFRAVFIGAVAFIGYNWIDPQEIGDIPFSQLTINDIFKPVLAIALVLGCIKWFFSIPDTNEWAKYWANIGYFALLVVIVLAAYLINS